eukprot:scaffold1541_cov418-Prasinococcus_capsulatus_cf.AAC.1
MAAALLVECLHLFLHSLRRERWRRLLSPAADAQLGHDGAAARTMAKTTTTVAKKKTGKAALGVSSKGVCKASKDKKTAASTRSDKKATANGTEKKKRKTPEAEPTKAKKAKAGKAKAEKAANGNATETPDEAEAAVVPAGALENFNISEPVKKALTKKGINSLFPIQISTYKIILEEGADVIGRARTGQGKTLAFVLPVIESLCRKYGERTSRPAYGRAPGVLVLTPTRELAKQVCAACDGDTLRSLPTERPRDACRLRQTLTTMVNPSA